MDNVLRVCNNGSGSGDDNKRSDLGNGVCDGGNDGEDDSGDSGGKFASITKSRLCPPSTSTVIIVTVT